MDAIVIEVAGCVIVCETAALLDSRVFAKTVDSVILPLEMQWVRQQGSNACNGRIYRLQRQWATNSFSAGNIETGKITGMPVLIDKAALSSETIAKVL